MPYVSCRYAPPPPSDVPNLLRGGGRQVICTDDKGQEWWLADDSEVGDWLRFLEEGGTVEPYEEPQE